MVGSSCMFCVATFALIAAVAGQLPFANKVVRKTNNNNGRATNAFVGVSRTTQRQEVGNVSVVNVDDDALSQLDAPSSALIYDGPFMLYAAHHLKLESKLSEIAVQNGSPVAFYAKSATLVIAAFTLMFFYSKWQDVIAERTGLKLAHFCCVIYAGLSISIDLSIKNAAEAYGGSFPFNPACGVVVVEYAKLIISAVLFAVHLRESMARGESVPLPSAKDIGWMAVPAAIYAANNLIVFQAIKSTPLSSFGVIRETMLIWNALIWTATFGQPISRSRWFAIMGIFLGCSVNQLPKMLGDEFTFGVLWACLLAFTNAAGAVANEYAMKRRAQVDINLQNTIVYTMCGTFVLIGIAIFNRSSVQSADAFFTGFVPECWTVIILQAFTGLAVSRILKYVEAVTKTIVAAIRGPGVIFIGAIIFHKQLHASEMFATLCVCTACWVYLREGPLLQPKALAATTETSK